MRAVDALGNPGGPCSQSKLSPSLYRLLGLRAQLPPGAQCCEALSKHGPDSSFSGCENRHLVLWVLCSALLSLWWSFISMVSDDQGFPAAPLIAPILETQRQSEPIAWMQRSPM